MIPYGRQAINERDISAVIDVLKSDWLTQGPVVPLFEQAIAHKTGANHAVAVNSATSALHLACLALQLGSNDWLWTSPNTFVASANCGIYCGAKVDFVDIDPHTYNMSISALSAKLEAAERLGTLPKIVVPVHFAGQSCDMQAIHSLAQRYGFKIIEDASHAIGGQYRDHAVGSCRYSDITVFSFHPVKIITTGEGGMATTNCVALSEKMRRLRSHGITRNVSEMTYPPDGPWYYEQLEIGYNYRLTDFQAALGLSQLNCLNAFITRRSMLASQYQQAFAELPISHQQLIDKVRSAWHLYVIRVPVNQRLRIFDQLRARGIGVNVHYIPVHLQPFYQKLGFSAGQFPQAETYYKECISLPLYSSLSDEQQAEVIKQVFSALSS